MMSPVKAYAADDSETNRLTARSTASSDAVLARDVVC